MSTKPLIVFPNKPPRVVQGSVQYPLLDSTIRFSERLRPIAEIEHTRLGKITVAIEPPNLFKYYLLFNIPHPDDASEGCRYVVNVPIERVIDAVATNVFKVIDQNGAAGD